MTPMLEEYQAEINALINAKGNMSKTAAIKFRKARIALLSKASGAGISLATLQELGIPREFEDDFHNLGEKFPEEKQNLNDKYDRAKMIRRFYQDQEYLRDLYTDCFDFADFEEVEAMSHGVVFRYHDYKGTQACEPKPHREYEGDIYTDESEAESSQAESSSAESSSDEEDDMPDQWKSGNSNVNPKGQRSANVIESDRDI